MRSGTVLGVLVAGMALVAGCGNDSGVTGNTSPTPTPTATPTPSTSNMWTLTPTQTQQACGATGVAEDFPASITIPIDTSGTNFIPDWGLANDPGVGASGIVNAPAGTVSGNAFDASWDYCRFDGLATYRKQWHWTGTLANGSTSFTNSVMTDIVMFAAGDQRAACITAVTTPLANCSSPGLTWTINGTRQ